MDLKSEVSKAIMDEKARVALIYGSTRTGRFCDTVAGWVCASMANKHEYELDVVDPGNPNGNLAERLEQADAFIVVTPEYNHGYPAPLKALLDSHGKEWHAKPVAFVSYGGVSGGIRAVEQLRQVFVELHAMTIRDAVVFPNAWEQFDAAGKPIDSARAERSLNAMLKRLHWWAIALRIARTARPYAAAA